jgi:CrcB protein
MINTIAAVAAGGAIGTLMRYGANISAVKLLGTGFPYATMFVNITGSALMGVLIIVLAHIWSPSEFVRVFLVTGVLGAFTTFSTFSLDFANLWERNDYLAAGVYLGGSVILSIAALFLATALTRTLIS